MSVRRVKPWVFVACLVPLAWLVWRGVTGELTANPIEDITHRTGDWALRLLLATLAITPLRRMLGWSSLASYRRMVGLFAFFYAALHLSTYLVLDFFFAFDLILDDVIERRYVTAGVAGFMLLLPLALTSTTGTIRRLGGARWRQLHRLVYLAAVAGVVHYLWLVKIDIGPPLVYAAVLAVLLGLRLWFHYVKRPARRAAGRSASQPIS
jgi:sulfoxide reductase heme-binding subunit YedZ